VLASDGVWDVVRNSDVYRACWAQTGRSCQLIANDIIQLALRLGSLDNVSCVVVGLHDYAAEASKLRLTKFTSVVYDACDDDNDKPTAEIKKAQPPPRESDRPSPMRHRPVPMLLTNTSTDAPAPVRRLRTASRPTRVSNGPDPDLVAMRDSLRAHSLSVSVSLPRAKSAVHTDRLRAPAPPLLRLPRFPTT
jgi:hypothetical protein